MRITIKAQMPVIPVVSRIWVDFDAMLDNLETLNFRAFEKGLLTDTAGQVQRYNREIEKRDEGILDGRIKRTITHAKKLLRSRAYLECMRVVLRSQGIAPGLLDLITKLQSAHDDEARDIQKYRMLAFEALNA